MVTFEKIAEVVRHSYDYTSLDTHHIIGDLKKSLSCLLIHTLFTLNPEYINSTISKAKLEIFKEIQKQLETDQLRYSKYSLTEDDSVLYVYISNYELNLDNNNMLIEKLSDTIFLNGERVTIFYIFENIKGSEGYKYIYNIARLLVNRHYSYTYTIKEQHYGTLNQYLLAPIVITLHELDLGEDKKKEVFDFFTLPVSEHFVSKLYNETRNFSIAELLDNGYIFALNDENHYWCNQVLSKK